MKTYLVTGGAGFIGSNFIHHILSTYKEECQVVNLDSLTYAGNTDNLDSIADRSNYHFVHGDICDEVLVRKLLSDYNVDYIIHFAAESHVDRSIEDSNVFARTNIMGTLSLLNAAKSQWQTENGYQSGKRFLFVSTDEVYGSLGSEGFFTEDTQLAPRNPYAASKASAEFLCKSYFDTYQFPVIRTRCSNNYGPYQYKEKLIPHLLDCCIHGLKLPIYGNGTAIRDWLHVSDHCRAIDLVVSQGELGKVYNIGGNTEKNTLDIAHAMINILNTKYSYQLDDSIITFVKDRQGHDYRYAIDASKIRIELGWFPAVTFEQGFEDTIAWYLQQSYMK
jgi:dTDP-glucose 4,6-dehydratase